MRTSLASDLPWCVMTVFAGVFSTTMAMARPALADEASVTVGSGTRFTEPPRSAPIAVDDDDAPPEPRRRSAFRLALGPSGLTSGDGFGLGVGAAADIGTGTVGGRFSATWLRGEGSNADGSSTPTGNAVGQYAGELTLDFHKRGPWHPILGTGIGLVHVSRPDGSGWAGVGLGRLGFEYALGIDDADVRLGASVVGGLVGPASSELSNFRAYAIPGLHVAVGL